jgi:hypothetical protein
MIGLLSFKINITSEESTKAKNHCTLFLSANIYAISAPTHSTRRAVAKYGNGSMAKQQAQPENFQSGEQTLGEGIHMVSSARQPCESGRTARSQNEN